MMDIIARAPESSWSTSGSDYLVPEATSGLDRNESILITGCRHAVGPSSAERRASCLISAGYFEMLALSTWRWKYTREETLRACDAAAAALAGPSAPAIA